MLFVHTGSLIYGYLTPIPDIFKIRFHCLCISIAPGWSNPRILKEINFHFKEISSQDVQIFGCINSGKVGVFPYDLLVDPAKRNNFCRVWIELYSNTTAIPMRIAIVNYFLREKPWFVAGLLLWMEWSYDWIWMEWSYAWISNRVISLLR